MNEIFSGLKKGDMNGCVKRFRETPGAVLLDVREVNEYDVGHIPGATNLPLSEMEDAEAYLEDKSAPIFIHCRSGVRSAQATLMLENMGYTTLMDIGGILDYSGEIEK